MDATYALSNEHRSMMERPLKELDPEIDALMVSFIPDIHHPWINI